MKRMLVLRVMIVATLAGACAGSADNAGNGSSTVARDSSGANGETVRIIEATGPATDEKPAALEIDSAASFAIGVSDGEEAYELHRVFDAMRLADGRMIIGNSGSQEIRIYSADGKYERSVGRRGAGPGEFSEYASIQFHKWADSLLATDDIRFHVYAQSMDTAITRTFDVTSGAARPFTRGVFSDGSLLVMAADGGGALGGDPGSIIDMSFQFMRYSPDGRYISSLLGYQGRQRYVHQFGDSRSFPYVPLTAELIGGVYGDSVVVLRDGLPELQWYDQEGKLVRIVRWSRARLAARDVYQEYVDSSLAGMRLSGSRDQEARYTDFYKLDLPLPQFAPLYTALVVDESRRVWLERFRMPGHTGPRRWDVIDASGEWLGTVSLPPRFTVFRIGRDFVLGRTVDSLGVERVQQHAILERQ